jgi:hypothetical protein
VVFSYHLILFVELCGGLVCFTRFGLLFSVHDLYFI